MPASCTVTYSSTCTSPVAGSTSTAQTSTMIPCAADEATRSSASGGSRFGAEQNATADSPGSIPSGSAFRIPVGHARDATESDRCRRRHAARIASIFAAQLERGRLHCPDAHAREPRRVVAGRDGPWDRGGIHLRHHRHVLPGRSRARLPPPARRRCDVPDPAASWPSRTVMPPSGSIAIAAPSALPDFGQRRRALAGGLGERDVAHVRDRGLHDARDADAGEPSVRACGLGPRPQRRVAGRARARRRGTPHSRPSHRGRPRACGRAWPRPARGCAERSSAGSRPSRRAPIAIVRSRPK